MDDARPVTFDPTHHPHRRFNPLTAEWVQVSPHRAERPWQGQLEKVPLNSRPAYDPGCYLCPGNQRAGGNQNPRYESTFVFENDFAALLPGTPTTAVEAHPLLRTMSNRGTCRVICYSPRHDLTLPEMPITQILEVVQLWISQTIELGRQFRWVQVFENKGLVMGCSNSHPHGQIWAIDAIPNEPAKEQGQQKQYLINAGRPLLVDYEKLERERGERVVVENSHWLAIVPYWAVWPFETMLLPRRHVARLTGLESDEQEALASILKRLLTKYDNLFHTSFPYSMGWHGAPFVRDAGFEEQAASRTGDTRTGSGLENIEDYWQLHAHFYPPLLRSPTIKKFMVGYEMLAEAQRDLTAEQAAARLRALPETHFRETEHDPA